MVENGLHGEHEEMIVCTGLEKCMAMTGLVPLISGIK